MPTYSYRCTECDNAFDIHQAFTDKTLTECPVCGGKLRKVFSPVGVTFKGSGFYRTDSRTKTDGHGGNRKHTRPETSSPSEAKSEKKSDSASTSSAAASAPAAASTATATSTPTTTRKSGATTK